MIKRNPIKLKEFIKDVQEDIKQIKDTSVRKSYTDRLEAKIDYILQMDDESPLTEYEIKKIVEDLNKFDDLIQLTFEHHQLTKKWIYFKSKSDYFKFFDQNELARNIKHSAKKGKIKLFQEYRPKIPKIIMPDKELKQFISDVLDSPTINDDWSPFPTKAKGKK